MAAQEALDDLDIFETDAADLPGELQDSVSAPCRSVWDGRLKVQLSNLGFRV